MLHPERKIYYWIKEMNNIRDRRKASKEHNLLINRAGRLIEYYVDEESIDCIIAREKYIKDNCFDHFLNLNNKYNHLYYELSDLDVNCLSILLVYINDDEHLRYVKGLLDNSKYRGCYQYVNYAEYRDKDLERYDVIIPTFIRGGMIDGDAIRYFLATAKKKDVWNKVVIPENGMLIGTCGVQYFDVFEPRDNEVVVDCGAYDGITESGFMKWGGERIRKIYAFELDPYNAKNCRKYYNEQGIDNVVLIEKGAWDKSETILIEGNGTSGSSTNSEGKVEALLGSIDDEVHDEVTFIKMDIEGAELHALRGAKETIKNYKPRLAICIYHKDEDIYTIPEYILSVCADYRFTVRHYTSMAWETVLYAECK